MAIATLSMKWSIKSICFPLNKDSHRPIQISARNPDASTIDNQVLIVYYFSNSVGVVSFAFW